MASLVKVKRDKGVSYRVQIYVDHKRYSKTFPVATTKEKAILILKQVRQFKKKIEVEIENYKVGLTDCVPTLVNGETRRDKITLIELTEELKEKRKSDFVRTTVARNVLGMNNLMECLGQDVLVSNLKLEHVEQFRKYRIETGRTSKEGINKDLVNITTMLNDGVRRGLIAKNPVPQMPKFKVERRLPKFYTADEIIKLKSKFDGDMWLAFLMFIYTGARRSEICQTRLGDGRGVRWRDVNWFNSSIRVRGKGEEKIKYMNKNLKSELAAEMRRRQKNGTFDTEDLVVHYICDTVTSKVTKVLKEAGMYVKGRGVHAFRHTFATETLKNTNIRVTQEALDHKNISTTEIYTHVVAEEKKRAVAALPY